MADRNAISSRHVAVIDVPLFVIHKGSGGADGTGQLAGNCPFFVEGGSCLRSIARRCAVQIPMMIEPRH